MVRIDTPMTSPAIPCGKCGSTDWQHLQTASITYRRRIVWDNEQTNEPYGFEKILGEDVEDETSWVCSNDHPAIGGISDDDADRLWDLNTELDFVS